jgi:creatinine amidohydrolase
MKKLKTNFLQDLTWPEIADYLKDEETIIIPIGATEEHGPAAAIGLDAYNAIYLAEDAAKRSGVLMTPPIWFGDSSHHTAFPGTISLRSETVIALMKDILRSLLKHGFKKILIINGHKVANLPALNIAAKDIHEYDYPDSIIAIADPWKIARGVAEKLKNGTIEHHAGVLEVSQLLYKRPDLVRLDKLSNTMVDYKEIFSEWGLFDLFGKSLNEDGNIIDIVWNSLEQKAFTANGQFSDNSAANKSIGQQYHEYMVGVLVDFLGWIKTYRGPLGQQSFKR